MTLDTFATILAIAAFYGFVVYLIEEIRRK